jgi:hypothetical protein
VKDAWEAADAWYRPEEKAAAVRMVRALRAEHGNQSPGQDAQGDSAVSKHRLTMDFDAGLG